MYFNVTADIGVEIHGYLIPDGFSQKPSIAVRVGDIEYGPIPCDIFLEGPYQFRHHETGIVGFKLTSDHVPDLDQQLNLEILDASTQFVFYRRFRPEVHLNKHVLRLETCFIPHAELDVGLKPYFQFYADRIEQYGTETVRQMLEVHNQPSLYISGRILFKQAQTYLRDDIVKIISMRDPFYELAVRIAILSRAKQQFFPFISKRDEMILNPVIEHFANANLANEDELVQRFSTASRDVLTLLDSPFIHQLVADNPSETVPREALSRALDILSQFTLFDPFETDDTLPNAIKELLQSPSVKLSFTHVRPNFMKLADTLRQMPLVESVIEKDLILYHFIRRAHDRVG